MIYLDNAATSFPKPPMVVRAMAGTLQKLGGNPGRSGHALSLCGGRIIQRCRELLAEAFRRARARKRHLFPQLHRGAQHRHPRHAVRRRRGDLLPRRA